MNIEEQIKDIFGYDEYEPSSLWAYLAETGKTDIVKELTNLLTQQREEADEVLLNMWLQFAYEGNKKGKKSLWCGGLSALEGAWDYLRGRKLIKGNGYPYLSQQREKGEE